MASLTRWVLAHKRIVVVFWVVLTLVGMASAGPATKALKQKFSVPGKEGWVTNQQIAHDFHGTGGNSRRSLPGRDAARGRVGRLGRGAQRNWPTSKPGMSASAARQPHRRLREHRQPRVRLQGRPHDVRRRLPAAGPHAGVQRQPEGGRRRQPRR